MKICKTDKKCISESVGILKNNGVIIYPTDTAYGLGGIFNSKTVTAKILKIKKRKDPRFTLIASSLYQVEKFFKLNSLEKKLAKKYWPGPLSIVVSNRFAIRVPKNKIAQSLARKTGRPLIATSANISGNATIYKIVQVINEFKNKKNQPSLIIDAGDLKKVKTSTLVKITKKNVKVLRQGSLKV